MTVSVLDLAEGSAQMGAKVAPSAALVDAALVRAGLATKGTLAERAKRLADYFERGEADPAGGGEVELLDCSECGYPSPKSEPACCFCGHAGEGAEEVPPDVSADPAGAERRLDAAIGRFNAFGREMVGAGWDMGNALREIHEHRLYLARREANTGQPLYRNFDEFCRDELKTTAQNARRMLDVARAFSRAQAVTVGTSKLSLVLKVTDPEAQARLLAAAPTSTVKELHEEVRRATAGEPPRETDRRGRAWSPPAPKLDVEPRQYTPTPGTRVVAIPSNPSRPGGAGEVKRHVDGGTRVEVLLDDGPTLSTFRKEEVAISAPTATSSTDAAPAKPPPKPRKRLTMVVEEGPVQVKFYARKRRPGDRRRAQTFADAPRAVYRAANGTKVTVRLHKGERGIYATLDFAEVKDK